jgi:hypothetical protein
LSLYEQPPIYPDRVWASARPTFPSNGAELEMLKLAQTGLAGLGIIQLAIVITISETNLR